MQLFIAYLKQLPSPLIPRALIDLILASAAASLSDAELLKINRSLIVALPLVQLHTAGLVFKTLREIIAAPNGITADNIADSLLPLLLPSDSVQLEIKLKVFLNLIQNSDQYFKVLLFLSHFELS
jgi:RhoGAP domain